MGSCVCPGFAVPTTAAIVITTNIPPLDGKHVNLIESHPMLHPISKCRKACFSKSLKQWPAQSWRQRHQRFDMHTYPYQLAEEKQHGDFPRSNLRRTLTQSFGSANHQRHVEWSVAGQNGRESQTAQYLTHTPRRSKISFQIRVIYETMTKKISNEITGLTIIIPLESKVSIRRLQKAIPSGFTVAVIPSEVVGYKNKSQQSNLKYYDLPALDELITIHF